MLLTDANDGVGKLSEPIVDEVPAVTSEQVSISSHKDHVKRFVVLE